MRVVFYLLILRCYWNAWQWSISRKSHQLWQHLVRRICDMRLGWCSTASYIRTNSARSFCCTLEELPYKSSAFAHGPHHIPNCLKFMSWLLCFLFSFYPLCLQVKLILLFAAGRDLVVNCKHKDHAAPNFGHSGTFIVKRTLFLPFEVFLFIWQPPLLVR